MDNFRMHVSRACYWQFMKKKNPYEPCNKGFTLSFLWATFQGETQRWTLIRLSLNALAIRKLLSRQVVSNSDMTAYQSQLLKISGCVVGHNILPFIVFPG